MGKGGGGGVTRTRNSCKIMRFIEAALPVPPVANCRILSLPKKHWIDHLNFIPPPMDMTRDIATQTQEEAEVWNGHLEPPQLEVLSVTPSIITDAAVAVLCYSHIQIQQRVGGCFFSSLESKENQG